MDVLIMLVIGFVITIIGASVGGAFVLVVFGILNANKSTEDGGVITKTDVDYAEEDQFLRGTG